jgi:hypothetical protein
MVDFSIQPGCTTYAIIALVVVVFIAHYMKPACVYNHDGSFKVFGLGYRNKTVVPMWLVVIVAAILSYAGITYAMQPSLNP